MDGVGTRDFLPANKVSALGVKKVGPAIEREDPYKPIETNTNFFNFFPNEIFSFFKLLIPNLIF